MSMIHSVLWNSRGVRDSNKSNYLADITKEKDVEIVFILEPKSNKKFLESWAKNTGFVNYRHFKPINPNIWVFWKDGIDIDQVECHSQCISIMVTSKATNKAIRMTAVYADTDYMKRRDLWNYIYSRNSWTSEPWIIGGDFNTIMNTGEKLGGVHPNIRAMNDFSLFQHENNLIDIGFEGPTYTWCNKHPNNLIWERLDRIFVNQAILAEYPNIRILHYPHVFSDHAPLVIYTSTAMSYKSSFQFLSMWFTHEGCEPLVQDVWKTDIQQPPMVNLQTKLKLTKIALKNWNRDTFGNIFQMIREANDRIQQLEDRARNDTSDEIRNQLYMANKN